MSPIESSPTWRPLPLKADDAGLPPLMISTCFTDSSYTVHLTDMANTWSEALDRRAIIMRGFQEDTSIDPSDGDNMKALISKLKDGFDASRPGHSRTRLSLASHTGKQTSEEGLLLTVKYTFPPGAGLKPLVWPLYLKKCPPSTTTTQLVLPLVALYRAQAREIDGLIQALIDKDAIIAKLLDKMENTGIGLENVFTSLPVKKKVTREVAETRINGLAPFKRSEWAAEFHALAETPPDTDALIQGVFGGTGVRYQPSLEAGATGRGNDWWRTIGTIISIPIRSDSGSLTDMHTSPWPVMPPVVDAGDDDDFQVQVTPPCLAKSMATSRRSVVKGEDDDDFQVQSTPPHLKPGQNDTKAIAQPSKPEEDESTEDDQPCPSSPPQPVESAGRRSLGTIGRNAKPKTPSPASPPPQGGGDESETASETEEQPSTKQASPPAPRPNRKALGRIGGKSTKDHLPAPDLVEELATPPTSNQESSSQVPRESRQRKLGMIGKRHVTEDAPVSVSRGRTWTPAAGKSDHRETSEERANRRRRELEREIAEKVAAPVRKKRKF